MTLQQLKALRQVADCGLNISRAANLLNTTQPAVSRMIRSLEQEIGTELLIRSGTRISGMTPQGAEILSRARQILIDVANLKLLAQDEHEAGVGVMKIGTTHTQACYGLVEVVKKFKALYPKVDLHIYQATQPDIIQAVAKGEIDIGVSSTRGKVPANVLLLDAYPIERCIIAPVGHPILKIRRPTLEDFARYPIVAYDERAQTGVLLRTLVESQHLELNVAMHAVDSTVVVAYVAAGVGIAILQKQIFMQEKHRPIGAIDANHLFPPTMTNISLRRDAYLRGFMYEFISMVSPKLTKNLINKMKLSEARR
jgi:LysR family cys regulon transcriptional activator